MTREGAERYIKSEMCKNCSVYLGGGKCSDNCKVIEAIEALEQEPRWIPVSERLPEKNVEVLATTESGYITIAEWLEYDHWFIHEGSTNAHTDELTAWMPLPTPYEPQESEGGEM